MTMGAPNTAVTELMLTSVGAKAVRAIRSQSRQNAPPPRKDAGMRMSGSAVPNRDFMRCGTAMPTKEIGPAKAVTQAELPELEAALPKAVALAVYERFHGVEDK